MHSRYIFVSVLCLVLTANSTAEQPSCADVAVNVIQSTGVPIQGLTAVDFSAEIKKQSAPIQSVSPDSSPRRVLVILDATRDLSTEGRSAEEIFAAGLIESLQPEDSLGLLTARGAVREVKFGADRTRLRQALDSGANEQDKGKLGVLDAVAEGITWFGEPRLGDTIVLMAMDLGDNHKTNLKLVSKMLEEHRIRLFGVAFGHLLLMNQTLSTQSMGREGFGQVRQGLPFSGPAGDADFLPLSVNSGGYIVAEDTASKRQEFKVTDAKKQELQRTATAMAAIIDKVYAVRLQTSPGTHSESWALSLSHAKVQELPGARVLYPHDLTSCSQPSAH
ncbi:MAG TPA: hypothetical protein VJA94_09940 [Candidatus Angelobacter sp.]